MGKTTPSQRTSRNDSATRQTKSELERQANTRIEGTRQSEAPPIKREDMIQTRD